ncbi:PE-PPE domain-containing protein [Thalassotalea ganghwensis]
MKTLVEQYIKKAFGDHLLDDLRIVLGTRFKPLHLLDFNTVRHPESEMNFRKRYILNKVKAKFSKRYAALKPKADNKAARVLFVNGIVTPYPLARHQADILAQSIGRDVDVIHNETEGLFRDLLECNQGRQGIINPVTKKVIQAIENKLEDDQSLIIVAYSQGAIIASSALIALSKRVASEQLSRISYITFGAGFKDSVLPKEIFCEHFANRYDPITHLGLQHQDFDFSGKLFIREARGHFFIADYLLPMMAGERYGDSWFEQQLLCRTANK